MEVEIPAWTANNQKERETAPMIVIMATAQKPLMEKKPQAISAILLAEKSIALLIAAS
jgi:hypothetical protein